MHDSYIYVSTFLFILLACIFKNDTIINLVFKMCFLILAVTGIALSLIEVGLLVVPGVDPSCR